jgi:DNA-binding MarR family transcriptional regulator
MVASQPDCIMGTGKTPRRPLASAVSTELRMWLRLLACSNIIAASLRRTLRCELGLSLPTFDILAQISRPPFDATMGDLSKRLMVSKGSITDLVRRLSEQGLVATIGDTADARVQRVYLTTKGRRVLDRALPVHNAHLRTLMADLDLAAIAQLAEQLGELRAMLRETGKPCQCAPARRKTARNSLSKSGTRMSRQQEARP